MSNTNYKLICKYAGDLPLTVGKEYDCFPVTGQPNTFGLQDDNRVYRFFTFPDNKYFDLVPVGATKPKRKVTDLKEREYINCTTIEDAIKINQMLNPNWTKDDIDKQFAKYGNNLCYRACGFDTYENCRKWECAIYPASDFLDTTPDPIIAQPADYIDPKLIEAYNALDENGKAIMQKTWPDVKWPKEVRYMMFEDWENDLHIFPTDRNGVLVIVLGKNVTPEINGGEIRFKINEP
jgi:hypothetical protein